MLTRSNTRSFVFLVAAAMLTAGTLSLRAAVPTAPTNLAATVNGLSVTFTWTAAGNSPTHYFLQAGTSPGTTLVEFNVGNVTTFPATGPAGTYYVRVIGANAEGRGPASNEVAITLTGAGGGCAVPGRPQNLRVIVRNGEVFIFWAPAAGTVSGYTLQAGTSSGQTFTTVGTTGTTINTTLSSGVYFLRVVANNACGSSQPSNEEQVNFAVNSGRVADPDAGTALGVPDVAQLINRIHNENPGFVNQSCPTGRKYETNPWQNRIVDRLRTYDTRFGYNAKPTRTAADNNGFPVIAAGDEFGFFVGGGNAEGSAAVVTFDILFDHCGTNPQQNVYRNIAPEPSIWTAAGRF